MKYEILKLDRKQELAAIAGKVEDDFWFVAPKIAAPYIADETVALAKQSTTGRQRKTAKTKPTEAKE